MRILLSDRDLRLVERAQNIMLSPDLDAKSDWHMQALRAVIDVTGADMGCVAMPGSDVPRMVSVNIDQRVNEYGVRVGELARRARMWRRAVAAGAFDRHLCWGSFLQEYHGSEYYNEYICALRGFDAIGLAAAHGSAPDASNTTMLLVHHGSEQGPKFGDRGLAIIRMLLPAFRAGALNYYALHGVQDQFASLLDNLPVGVICYGRHGQLLHANAAWLAMAAGPHATQLTQGVEGLRHRMLPMLADPRSIVTETGFEISLEGSRYVGTVALPHDCDPTAGAALLIIVEQHAAAAHGARELKARFGLTEQEARVALLVAGEGLSNQALAARLCISPHTARHHVERILDKLGISSRAAIAARIGTPTSDTGLRDVARR